MHCKAMKDTQRHTTENALPECCTFASVKASEPKDGHFRPVPTFVSIRSDVIYDPFRRYFRGVEYHDYDWKVTLLRPEGTSGTTLKYRTFR